MLSARDIENARIDLNGGRRIAPQQFEQEDRRTRIRPGSVLLTIVGTVGRSAVVPPNAPRFTVQRSVAVIEPAGVEPHFCSLFLRSPEAHDWFEENARGSAQKGVYLRTLARLRLPIPPLAEQKRIVAKVEALLARVNAVTARLQTARTILKRFRQSVLAAACSGRLTEDWREDPASEDDFAGWIDARLGDVATLHRGYDLPKHKRQPGTVPVYAANGCVGTHQDAKVSGPGVVTGRSGTIGQVHFVASDYWPLNTALYVQDFHGNYPQFIVLLLKDLRLAQYHAGTGVPTLNRNVVHEVEVAVPPLAEQHEIVRRVETLFRLADGIEAGIERASGRADRLTQAILAKAFRGELVPTEADLARRERRDYEPAEALLERIKAEREKHVGPGAGGGGRRRTKKERRAR